MRPAEGGLDGALLREGAACSIAVDLENALEASPRRDPLFGLPQCINVGDRRQLRTALAQSVSRKGEELIGLPLPAIWIERPRRRFFDDKFHRRE